MPKVRRRDFPPRLFQHLLERVQERRIAGDQLERLAQWLDGEPEVPEGLWFKRLPGLIVCGEGEWIKTFLVPGQSPKGQKVS